MNRNSILGIAGIILIVIFGGYLWYTVTKKPVTDVVCPLDALLCPDGTGVGRTGPDCSFATCADQTSYTGMLVLTDGVYTLEVPSRGGGEGVYSLPLILSESSASRDLVGTQVQVYGSFTAGNSYNVTDVREVPVEGEPKTAGTLSVGDTALFGGVQITLHEIVSDNRCPTDVQCIVAGAVVVRVTLEQDANAESFNLSTDEGSQTFGTHHVSITNVAPARVSTEEPVSTLYRVSFLVEPVESRSSIEQYLREHIVELSPVPAVLGGTFYVTNVDVQSDTTAVVEYEDGHIALTADVAYAIDPMGAVQIISFDVREE